MTFVESLFELIIKLLHNSQDGFSIALHESSSIIICAESFIIFLSAGIAGLTLRDRGSLLFFLTEKKEQGTSVSQGM